MTDNDKDKAIRRLKKLMALTSSLMPMRPPPHWHARRS